MKNISWYNTNESSSRGMKDSIGEKQIKVFIMRKFLTFFFYDGWNDGSICSFYGI